MGNIDNNSERFMEELRERARIIAGSISEFVALNDTTTAVESLEYNVLDDFKTYERDDYDSFEELVTDWCDDLRNEIEYYRDDSPADDYDGSLIFTADSIEWYVDNRSECDDVYAEIDSPSGSLSEVIESVVAYHRIDLYINGVYDFLTEVADAVSEIANESME